MKAYFLTVYSLWSREMKRFFRQRSRIVGAFGTPVIFWVFIGAGFGASFQAGSGDGYLAYFFPGTVFLIILFTAIFSTISLIQDRQEGFLQAVLIAPVPRSAIVLGKVLGGTALAFLQGVFFLIVLPFIGVTVTPLLVISASGMILFNAFFMTLLGFAIAWNMRSIQGFHAVMNLLFMPLWFLSGALFPLGGAPGWIRSLMQLNPLTYGLTLFRNSLGMSSGLEGLPASGHSFLVMITITIFLFFISIAIASRRSAASAL